MSTFKPSYNCRIKLDGTSIAGIRSGTLNSAKGQVDVTYLGVLARYSLNGLMDSSLDLELMLDTSSTQQNSLWDAYLNDTKLTTLTIWYDSTAYIELDLVNDADGYMQVTDFPYNNISTDDAVVTCPIKIQISGLIKRSTD